MIIVRVPLRITLGGGGTDLPAWYQENGGFLITAAIDKYIYLTGSERPFDANIWLSYSSVEVCKSVAEIRHELFAKCLAKYELPNGIEIHSISEVLGGTGLGSSGAFLVATLHLLNIMRKQEMNIKDIAELACQIEMLELSRPSGKQDQYIAAFGGIIMMDIGQEGNVAVTPLELDHITRKRLSNNILIYFSGVSRQADVVLQEQNSRLRSGCKSSVASMRRIQEIGRESKTRLVSGDLDKFGHLLHEHWEIKKGLNNKISSSFIDEVYGYGRRHGALGGKVMGAGGGGYFMFYVTPEQQDKFRHKMKERGLVEMDWQFDFLGVTKIFSG